MTFLLVLAAVLTLAALHWAGLRRRARLAGAARSVAADPRGSEAPLLLHPGHTWLRLSDDGIATVGSTPFAAHFVGALAQVELPKEGRRFRQAEPAWTLISDRGRRLEQVMPVAGKVLAVNADLLRDPLRAQTRPLDEGWICRIRPRGLARGARNLMSGTAARRWLDATRSAVNARLGVPAGATAYDGGEWIAGFGGRFAEGDWQELKSELFPAGRVVVDKVHAEV